MRIAHAEALSQLGVPAEASVILDGNVVPYWIRKAEMHLQGIQPTPSCITISCAAAQLRNASF